MSNLNGNAATLQRETFSTSRLLEFFTEKELNMQIGVEQNRWAIALLKELIDNALDACEGAGIAPVIEVEIEDDAVSVRDNGPGIPADTINRSLDYSVRVSDKSYYVSPTRGQLGNALKCLWAAPYVVTGLRGAIEAHANGRGHVIDVQLDRIAQEPRIDLTETDSEVKTGTFIKFGWPEIASYLSDDDSDDSYFGADKLLLRYAAFNPHATFKLKGGNNLQVWDATDTEFKRWMPSEPTSPHWYDEERFISLISAYLAKERAGGQARTVREFVAEFRGLSGSAKLRAVTDGAGLKNCQLSDLIVNGEVDRAKASSLLQAMKQESRAVKPAQLGAVGKEHLTRYLLKHHKVDDPDQIEYRKVEGESDGLPFILETAFGLYGEQWRSAPKEEIIGLNWAPALGAPVKELPRMLGAARVDDHDPVVLVMHIACPRFTFTDRGKSAIALR